MKQRSWKERDPNDLEKFLGSHMVPVIVGPGQRKYLIDHHHLARALHEVGRQERVRDRSSSDLHKLDVETFWNMMDYHGWTHPFDAKGRRRGLRRSPGDDRGTCKTTPIARWPENCGSIGGYAKDSTPYSEFVWADFLRLRIKPKAVKQDFSAALGVGARFGAIRRSRLSARLVRPAPKAVAAAARDAGARPQRRRRNALRARKRLPTTASQSLGAVGRRCAGRV